MCIRDRVMASKIVVLPAPVSPVIKKRPFSPKAAILMTVSLAKGPKALMVIVNGLINVSPPSPERFFAQ